MSFTFTDTHCHFDFPPFTGNEQATIERAAAAGIRRIIVPAVGADRFDLVLSLAHRYPALFAALGLHPIIIEQHQPGCLDRLESILSQRPNKLVAIGEIGLDLYREDPQFVRQEAVLEAQLQLAKRYLLPVILHSRRTHDKLGMHLRRLQLPRTGVVHGFAGSYQQAKKFVDLGYFIGVGGTITYPRATKTRDVMARLPLDALVLETDAPDMPLNGHQGEPNRPERAREVFDILCELRQESPETVALALNNNTFQLFGI